MELVQRPLRCQRHSKEMWSSEAAAQAELDRILAAPEDHRVKLPRRVYEADCGFWHLTSQAPRNCRTCGKQHLGKRCPKKGRRKR